MANEHFAEFLAAKPRKQDIFYLMVSDNLEYDRTADCLKALLRSASGFELTDDECVFCAGRLARLLDDDALRQLLPDLDRNFLRRFIRMFDAEYRDDLLHLYEAAVQIVSAGADAMPEDLVRALRNDSVKTSDSALERLLELDADALSPEVLISALSWTRLMQMIDESLHFARLLVERADASPVQLAELINNLHNNSWDGVDELVFSGKADAIRAAAVRRILENPHAGDESLVVVVEMSYDKYAAMAAARLLLAPEHPDLSYGHYRLVRGVAPDLAASRLTRVFAALDKLLESE